MAKGKGVSVAYEPGATGRRVHQPRGGLEKRRWEQGAGQNPLFCTMSPCGGVPVASSRFQAPREMRCCEPLAGRTGGGGKPQFQTFPALCQPEDRSLRLRWSAPPQCRAFSHGENRRARSSAMKRKKNPTVWKSCPDRAWRGWVVERVFWNPYQAAPKGHRATTTFRGEA